MNQDLESWIPRFFKHFQTFFGLHCSKCLRVSNSNCVKSAPSLVLRRSFKSTGPQCPRACGQRQLCNAEMPKRCAENPACVWFISFLERFHKAFPKGEGEGSFCGWQETDGNCSSFVSSRIQMSKGLLCLTCGWHDAELAVWLQIMHSR